MAKGTDPVLRPPPTFLVADGQLAQAKYVVW